MLYLLSLPPLNLPLRPLNPPRDILLLVLDNNSHREIIYPSITKSHTLISELRSAQETTSSSPLVNAPPGRRGSSISKLIPARTSPPHTWSSLSLIPCWYTWRPPGNRHKSLIDHYFSRYYILLPWPSGHINMLGEKGYFLVGVVGGYRSQSKG